MSPACRHVATIKIIYIATRTVNETSQKCSQYLDKASRLLLFRPSTCWKRPLIIWLWKLLWNYISNIYITMSIYLLALRCLCGGFHGSMPPQNQVGSSMVIGFIIYLKLICSECHGCHQPPTSCDNSHKKQLGSVLRRGVLVNFLHRPSSWLNLRLQ